MNDKGDRSREAAEAAEAVQEWSDMLEAQERAIEVQRDIKKQRSRAGQSVDGISRRRSRINGKRFTVVCSCADPAVVVRRYDVEREEDRRAEMLELHDHPSVPERLFFMKPVERRKSREDVFKAEEAIAERLYDGTQYEAPDEEVKLHYRVRLEIIRESTQRRRERGEAALGRTSKAEDVGTYQGSRSKPIEWRCPRCNRTVRPTAKQAETIAHTYLLAGVSRVDILALARTIGRNSGRPPVYRDRGHQDP